jgi:hypothetical protein
MVLAVLVGVGVRSFLVGWGGCVILLLRKSDGVFLEVVTTYRWQGIWFLGVVGILFSLLFFLSVFLHAQRRVHWGFFSCLAFVGGGRTAAYTYFRASPSIAGMVLFVFSQTRGPGKYSIILSMPLRHTCFSSLCNVGRTYRQNGGSQISLSSTKNR